MFGGFSATLDGRPITSFESNKVRALLVYLATETDRPHSRDQLAALLWPELSDQAARNNLRYALSNLRKAIGDTHARQPFLDISNGTVKLDLERDVEVDILTFSRQLGGAPALSDLEEAIRLYRGDFLEGFFLGSDAAFEEWAILKREQLRRQVLDALHRLAQAYEKKGDINNALSASWRLVDLEPWSEEAHRYLMLLLGKSGKRTEAISQYETCRRILAKELNIEPSVETTRIYEQIRDGEIAPLRPVSKSPPQPMEKKSDLETELSIIASSSTSPIRNKKAIRWLKIASAGLIVVILAWTVNFFLNKSKASLPANISGNTTAIGKIVGPCLDQDLPRICITNAQTGQILQAIENLPLDRLGPGFSWSPDGKQIVFVASAKPKQEKDDFDLYVINADGSNLRQITSGDGIDILPAWSPNGKWIAFHRNCTLWTTNPDGTNESPLSSGLCAMGIAWSPDSYWIAFLETGVPSSQRPATIRVFEYRGSDSRIVYTFSQPVSHGHVAWSPDGQQLFFMYSTGGIIEENTLLLDAQGRGAIAQDVEIPISWMQDFYPQWGK